MIELLLTVLLVSAMATDCIQTEHWIDGTIDNPIKLPNGTQLYEVNTILAGRPENREVYFDFAERVAINISMLDPPLSTAILAGYVFYWGKTIITNNNVSKQNDLPLYYAIQHKIYF